MSQQIDGWREIIEGGGGAARPTYRHTNGRIVTFTSNSLLYQELCRRFRAAEAAAPTAAAARPRGGNGGGGRGGNSPAHSGGAAAAADGLTPGRDSTIQSQQSLLNSADRVNLRARQAIIDMGPLPPMAGGHDSSASLSSFGSAWNYLSGNVSQPPKASVNNDSASAARAPPLLEYDDISNNEDSLFALLKATSSPDTVGGAAAAASSSSSSSFAAAAFGGGGGSSNSARASTGGGGSSFAAAAAAAAHGGGGGGGGGSSSSSFPVAAHGGAGGASNFAGVVASFGGEAADFSQTDADDCRDEIAAGLLSSAVNIVLARSSGSSAASVCSASSVASSHVAPLRPSLPRFAKNNRNILLSTECDDGTDSEFLGSSSSSEASSVTVKSAVRPRKSVQKYGVFTAIDEEPKGNFVPEPEGILGMLAEESAAVERVDREMKCGLLIFGRGSSVVSRALSEHVGDCAYGPRAVGSGTRALCTHGEWDKQHAVHMPSCVGPLTEPARSVLVRDMEIKIQGLTRRHKLKSDECTTTASFSYCVESKKTTVTDLLGRVELGGAERQLAALTAKILNAAIAEYRRGYHPSIKDVRDALFQSTPCWICGCDLYIPGHPQLHVEYEHINPQRDAICSGLLYTENCHGDLNAQYKLCRQSIGEPSHAYCNRIKSQRRLYTLNGRKDYSEVSADDEEIGFMLEAWMAAEPPPELELRGGYNARFTAIRSRINQTCAIMRHCINPIKEVKMLKYGAGLQRNKDQALWQKLMAELANINSPLQVPEDSQLDGSLLRNLNFTDIIGNDARGPVTYGDTVIRSLKLGVRRGSRLLEAGTNLEPLPKPRAALVEGGWWRKSVRRTRRKARKTRKTRKNRR